MTSRGKQVSVRRRSWLAGMRLVSCLDDRVCCEPEPEKVVSVAGDQANFSNSFTRILRFVAAAAACFKGLLKGERFSLLSIVGESIF